ncbi:hypothetical protein [Burkholderia pseudomallei]|uniref:hypothetical protein n=1 Tax=Burkholderia pseudomallei TaxID=28450 RepID=UPI0012F52737|nr:hypothetical protein [Burkholderia pseudomallei]
MGEFKGTRGPWHIRTFDGSKWTIDDERDNSVAQAQQVKPLPADRLQIERTANARLIAAAPELLEACSRMVEIAAPNIYPTPDKPNSAWAHLQYARAAIAKALGD